MPTAKKNETEDWGAPVSGAPIHDFKEGGDLVGTVIGHEKVRMEDTNNPGEMKDVDLYTFDKGGGAFVGLWGSAVIARAMEPHTNGHRVKVVDTGKLRDLGNGQSLHEYLVYCATCTARRAAQAQGGDAENTEDAETNTEDVTAG